MKARKIAKARWIDRASVEFKTPKLKINGNGEASQSWNSDHATASHSNIFAVKPLG